jgi:chromosomal replication initiator protein
MQALEGFLTTEGGRGVMAARASGGVGVAEKARRQQSDEVCEGECAAPDQAIGEVWARIRRKLRAELGEDVVASWFGSVEVSRALSGQVTISVPTRFLKSWIETHYCERLRRHFTAEIGVGELEIVLRQAGRPAAKALAAEPRRVARPDRPAETPAAATMAQAAPAAGDDGAPLDRRLTFDSFLVGRSNELAHAAARRVAEAASRGAALYNPLYLHAAVGLGKTHLAQAVAHAVAASGRRTLYLTADRFMHGFAAALRSQNSIGFKDRLRGIDLLIVDDVQFLQGRAMQQEFGHTVNALVDAGRQVVVCADRPPHELDALDERVRSRLSGGLVVEMDALDEELRLRILRARLEAARTADEGFEVAADVPAYVASVVVANGRDLDGAVNRLLAHASITGQTITREMAEVAIRDLVRTREPRRVRIDDILRTVSNHFNVSRSDILSARRTASVVKPRQIAMYLSKVMTLRSLPDIGRRFGGRDHTTVLHAVRKIEGLIEKDGALREEIAHLRRLLDE